MVISITAFLLVMLGLAVQYTQGVSRHAQRSRRTAQAMEIADGHLELLFANWRNIYRSTWTTTSDYMGGTDVSLLGGNYFFTSMWNGNPGPAPTPIPYMNPAATPVPIPTPAKALFPSESNYQLTQYRIQGVDPMIHLDASETALRETTFGSEQYVPLSPGNVPPAAYGKNKWQYSLFYLASVDVTLPSTTGDVKAKVRRVFEKKFDNPWVYAMFYVDDLEFQPSNTFSVDGPIHTNGNLYIGTNNFTTNSSVGYAGEYVNGYSPNDTAHSGTVTAPNFAKSDPSLTLSDMPPAQVSPYLPFGWNLKLVDAGGNVNDDSYHELIEIPAGGTDPLANIRLYNQAAYRVLIDINNNVIVTRKDGTVATGGERSTFTNAVTTNEALWDPRENAYVRLATLNIRTLSDSTGSSLPNWNGIVYIADQSPDGTTISSRLGGSGSTVTSTKRGIRLINGYRLPGTVNGINGLTVVSGNPVYIKGNYNTSTNSGDTVPSNNGTYTDPDASGYTRRLAAVIGDSITILSGAWTDNNSVLSIGSRAAMNTTVNAALVGGIVPSSGGNYSGGGESFVRFLEDWKTNTFCSYGSMVQLFVSKTGTGVWSGSGSVYKAPLTCKFYWDPNFSDPAVVSSSSLQSGPPGNLQIAAYLQQQRWYQVY